MLCVVIQGSGYDLCLSQVLRANREADMLELRLDLMSALQLEEVFSLRSSAEIPVIFALRPERQGGKFTGTEDERLQLLKQYAAAEPDYIDLEYDVPVSYFEEFKQQQPGCQLICSYHDFEKTPEDLDALFARIRECPADLYKIAVYAQDAVDALRVLIWIRNASLEGHPVAAVAMGEDGACSRILGRVFGSKITYTFFDDASAPGQIPLHVMTGRFRYRLLDHETSIYGVIGDPVSLSRGELVHNAIFHAFDKNAVYVKFKVPKNRLQRFLILAEEANIAGFSVTMPLKEDVVYYLTHDSEDRKIGAVNTLKFTEKGIAGLNTDGKGALEAIEELMPVRGKRVAIIGAGGAARAVAFEAAKRGAKIFIFNRTEEKAKELAELVGGKAYPLADCVQVATSFGYDILVQCTSVGMQDPSGLPIPPGALLPDTVVLDCVHAAQTTALGEIALAKGCQVISGMEMYVRQGAEQAHFWTGISTQKASEVIRSVLGL